MQKNDYRWRDKGLLVNVRTGASWHHQCVEQLRNISQANLDPN